MAKKTSSKLIIAFKLLLKRTFAKIKHRMISGITNVKPNSRLKAELASKQIKLETRKHDEQRYPKKTTRGFDAP